METQYLGGGKAKVWTYLILAVVLLVGVVIANFALTNPQTAKNGFDMFLGLPSWAFPTIALVTGILVYWLGLKIETDWPEGVGAAMVAGAIAAGELMIGWEKFELGGMVVLPYVLPLLVFLGMMGYSVVKSR